MSSESLYTCEITKMFSQGVLGETTELLNIICDFSSYGHTSSGLYKSA